MIYFDMVVLDNRCGYKYKEERCIYVNLSGWLVGEMVGV